MWKWEEIKKLNICDIEDGALDAEFDLAPEGYLWHDQTTFFKLAHAAIKYDFESEEGFAFCASPPFNTFSTENLKEVVASGPQRRKLSSGSRRRRDSFSKKTPSKIGCFQGLWHWDQFTEKSVLTLIPTSKWSMRWKLRQIYLECADTKFRISSPAVTEEPLVKFNTVHRGLGQLVECL